MTDAKRTRPATARELGLMVGFPPPHDKLVSYDMVQDAPFNRWAFQNISQLLPTATIGRGSGDVWRFTEQQADLDQISFQGMNGQLTVAEMLDATYTDGFLVLKDGAVVRESYCNDMGPQTHHLLMSVSKSVTSALVGILVDRGLIDPASLLTRYIPELRESAYGDATVQQALDMAVAVVFNEDYADPNSEIQRFDRANGWRLPLEGDKPGTYRFIQGLKKAGEHGKEFQYCSANTDVLGWIVERVTDTSYADALSRELWSKLGAEHDVYVTVDRYGTALPDGGICTTLRDLARFGQMILQHGFGNGQSIVPAAWIHETRRQGEDSIQLNGDWWPEVYANGTYHNQWWHTGDDHRSFFATGIHGQNIWIDPATNVVIVKFSSIPDAVDRALGFDSMAAFAAISRELG